MLYSSLHSILTWSLGTRLTSFVLSDWPFVLSLLSRSTSSFICACACAVLVSLRHLYHSSLASNSAESFNSNPSYTESLDPYESPTSEFIGPDGHLTEAERNRRRQYHLCFYCGGEHLKVDCELLKNRNQFAETDYDPSDEGSDAEASEEFAD